MNVKKTVLIILFTMICGALYTGCDLQDTIADEQQDEVTATSQDEITEEPDETDDESDSESFQGVITYPKSGRYGLNILADDFVEAYHDKISSSGEAMNVYSMNAELPEDNASLKIVIKSTKPALYVCMNRLPTHSSCEAEFSERHEVCPKCGGVNTLIKKDGNEWGHFSLQMTGNWWGTAWDENLRGNTFTVIESGKPTDAIVMFWNDCIIEYYENGSKTPTKIKEIKVID